MNNKKGLGRSEKSTEMNLMAIERQYELFI